MGLIGRIFFRRAQRRGFRPAGGGGGNAGADPAAFGGQGGGLVGLGFRHIGLGAEPYDLLPARLSCHERGHGLAEAGKDGGAVRCDLLIVRS